jgi:hypothetical protein
VYLALYIGFYPPLIVTTNESVWTGHVFSGPPFVSVFQRGEYAVLEVDGLSTKFFGDACDLYGKKVLPGAPLVTAPGAPLQTLDGQCLTSFGGGVLVYGSTSVSHFGGKISAIGNEDYAAYDIGYQLSTGPWGGWVPGSGACSPRPLFVPGCLWWCGARPCQNGIFVYGDTVYYVCPGAEFSYAYGPSSITTLPLHASDCWGHGGSVKCGGFYGDVFGAVGEVVPRCDVRCELDVYFSDALFETISVPVHRIDRVLVYGDDIFLFYDKTLVYGNASWTWLSVGGTAFIGDLFVFVDTDTRIYDPRPTYGPPCWRTLRGRYEYFEGTLFNKTHYVELDYAGPCERVEMLTFSPRPRAERVYEQTYTAEANFVFDRCDALEHVFANDSGRFCVADVDECEPGYWLNTSANEDGATSEPCVLCVDCTRVTRVSRPTLGSTGPVSCPAGQYRNGDSCFVCNECWMTRRVCGVRDTECYTFTRDAYYFELFIGLQVVFALAPLVS